MKRRKRSGRSSRWLPGRCSSAMNWCVSRAGWLLQSETHADAVATVHDSPKCIDSTLSSTRRWASCRTCQPSYRRTCRLRTSPTTSMLPKERRRRRSLRPCFRTRRFRSQTCRQSPASRTALLRRSRPTKASKSVHRTTRLLRLRPHQRSISPRLTMLRLRLHLHRWRAMGTKMMTRCHRRLLLRWGRMTMHRRRRPLRSLSKAHRHHQRRKRTLRQ